MNVPLPLLLLLFAASPALSEGVRITNVSADSAAFDAAAAEPVPIRFRLSGPADVTLLIYDGRDIAVTTIRSSATLAPGDHVLEWDRTDSNGRAVPAGAYAFTLRALGNDGTTTVHDITDVTGGRDLVPRDVNWDPETGLLSYVLDAPARVNVRLGLRNNGPLLNTLIDWVPRSGGLQHERWDGFDASRVVDLSRHPKLFFSVTAFTLPENTILVGKRPDRVQIIPDLPRAQRPGRSRSPAKRMYAHAQQTLEGRGDFSVSLTVPETLPRTPGGLPIVSAPVRVVLDVAPEDLERALARRFEPVFFVDGQFAFENEVGFVPMSWTWDPAGVNPGEHVLTVNLRGYEGNFGMASVRVSVQPAASPRAR